VIKHAKRVLSRQPTTDACGGLGLGVSMCSVSPEVLEMVTVKKETEMTEKEIYTRLTRVFQDVFDDDTLQINGETTADDVDDWDSLSHITLIAAVENEFGMRFKMKEVSTMANVGEMVDLIAERGH
jgi:acyl carrier protein